MKRYGPLAFSLSPEERELGVPFCFRVSRVPELIDKIEVYHDITSALNEFYGVIREMVADSIDPKDLLEIESQDYSRHWMQAPEKARVTVIALRGLQKNKRR